MGVMIFDHSTTFDTIDGRTSLKDIVSTNSILVKVGFYNLNEMVASQTAVMVWKSQKARDPLGTRLFPNRTILRTTRSINSNKATQRAPGNNTLANGKSLEFCH